MQTKIDMWYEIEKHLPHFETAVLTGVDALGYPVSIRCHPRADARARKVHVRVPKGVEIQPGPAGLLCHRHDERLWKLKSFIVRGVLERDSKGWFLRPQQFVPGMGIGGPMSWVRFVRNGRQTAKHYLEARGLPRPQIPWQEVNALLARAHEEGPALVDGL
ncbi:MAG: hypothetical protein M3220_03115 [Chloroflexota bacterium]|nr:hypothetical protein [Chloroflexota bacterium]